MCVPLFPNVLGGLQYFKVLSFPISVFPPFSTLTPVLSQIFPDAVKRNLPELLPMTHLCDHLLTICHYMHGRWRCFPWFKKVVQLYIRVL